MPELDGLQATQRIRRLEEKSAAQRGTLAAELEAAAARCDASRSGALGGVTGRVARVPIIAVSSCSEMDQLLSPALADVDTTTGAPLGVDRAVFTSASQLAQNCTFCRLCTSVPHFLRPCVVLDPVVIQIANADCCVCIFNPCYVLRTCHSHF